MAERQTAKSSIEGPAVACRSVSLFGQKRHHTFLARTKGSLGNKVPLATEANSRGYVQSLGMAF
jgi:hypothetical protein